MKQLAKKIVALLMCTLFISNSITVKANSPMKPMVYLNDETIELNHSVFFENETLYIPIRSLADILEYEVEWVNETRDILLYNDKNVVTLNVDKYSYNVNGIEYLSKGLKPIIKNGTTYVPESWLRDMFGIEAKMDSAGTLYFYQLGMLSSITYTDEEVNAILKDFFGFTDAQIAELSDEEIEEILAVFEELIAQGYNQEKIDELNQKSMDAVFGIMESAEFASFVNKVLSSENFNNLMQEILSSENFNKFMVEILENEEIKYLTEKLMSLESYDAYIEDVQKLDSYKSLEAKYGSEMLLGNNYDLNSFDADYINKYFELILDPEYMDLTKEMLTLDSYIAYQEDLMEIMYNEEYIAFESILEIDSLNAFVEEIMISENLYKLTEEIMTMTETFELMELVDNTIAELMSEFDFQ